MADISVNEYVRTIQGYIAKLESIYNDMYDFDSSVQCSYDDEMPIMFEKDIEKYITKHSFNIIDLIEIGDYVNGVKIGKEELFDNGLRIISEDIGDCYYETTFRSDKPEEVKTIVTHEQFENIEHRVGGEND